MKPVNFLEGVKIFLTKKGRPEATGIDGDTPLIDSGIVDSILLTELIIYVEDFFDTVIDVESFNIKSFSSVNHIVASYAA